MKTKTLADNPVGHIIQLIAKHSMVASRVSSVGEYGTLTDGDMSGQFLPAVSSKLKFILQIKLSSVLDEFSIPPYNDVDLHL